jgi:RHS repeat-associated protein
MENKIGVATPAISLPKGGGTIKGIGETFQPNLFTGTGNFSIPIATSPGRNGFSPQLTLEYSTGNGNGPFGLGWQLSIPRITCKTEKGLPTYTDDGVFVMSGAEDLVPHLKEVDDIENSGEKKWDPVVCDVEDDQGRVIYKRYRYRPRTEGLFARIEKWVHEDDGDIHWRVTTKENVISIYGKTESARIYDPEYPDHIFEWLLQETFDAKGNHILYEYAQEHPNLFIREIYEDHRMYRDYASQRYIRRIYYGNTPDSLNQNKRKGPVRNGTHHRKQLSTKDRHYVFEVIFDYGNLPTDPVDVYEPAPEEGKVELINPDINPRDDSFSTYRSRFELRTLRRCRGILMFHHFQELEAIGKPQAITLVKSTDFQYEQNPDTKLSFLSGITVTGYRWDERDQEFKIGSMVPVTFKYSEFKPQEQRYQSVTANGNDLPHRALNDPNFTLMDLFGDGLPDILNTTNNGYYFWQNLGECKVDRRHPQHEFPTNSVLSDANVAMGDMGGDGLPDILVEAPGMSGFYEARPDGKWKPFKRFEEMPSFSLVDPNVRLVDLTGDGLSDMLMTCDHHFLWVKCLGEKGYDKQPNVVERKYDLNEFPDVYFNDPSGRVRMADMTGDGLNDIVLVHNGRIDYWPNLGYGEFGKRITMANAPRLDYNFNPQRLFLVDLDGTGCSDLVYVDFNKVDFCFNQSGNGWSDEQVINGTPAVSDSSAIQFADFFGTGTATLVWSYDFNFQPGSNYKVLDFCGGVKPHLLIETDNNMGATTKVQYVSSTKFYLADKKAGRPWVTNLPFPVQVLEKTEVIDHISKTKLVTTYKYHHGYYDGREREFRGFGRVDQCDSEEFETFANSGLHEGQSLFTNSERVYHVPPVMKKSWFHTGVYFDDNLPSANGVFYDKEDMLNAYRQEFYQGDENAFLLQGHDVEPTGTPHEAYRALRGSLVRSETYAIDGTDKEAFPYTVTQKRFEVKQLQAKAANNYAVYLAWQKENTSYHYERNPEDPRVGHEITLKVDEYGNMTDKVTIGYPRRNPVYDEQGELKVLYTKADFINKPDETDFYFIGIACQSRAFEVTGIEWDWSTPAISREVFEEVIRDPENFEEYDWVRPDGHPDIEKRLVEWSRYYFKTNDQHPFLIDPVGDLAQRLLLGEIESLGLPYENYTAAFTEKMRQEIYDRKADEIDLGTEGGYHSEPNVDDYWWIPSGKQSFNANKFYLPENTQDPFGNISELTLDDYALLMIEARDPVDNVIEALNDYRVLKPYQIKDPNGNFSAVSFDALGMVVGSAVWNEDPNGNLVGDSLDDYVPDLDPIDVNTHIDHPLDGPHTILNEATTRLVYDLDRYMDSGQPIVVYTLAREIHAQSPGGRDCNIKHSFVYSDGFGREVQTKIQAERDLAMHNEPRWVGTGTTIYNNKGKAVEQYEPFFSSDHQFSIEKEGVSPILFYDPLERVVCTAHPNHTYEKVVFDAWGQETWDENDSIHPNFRFDPQSPSNLPEHTYNPADDPDVGFYFRHLPEERYLPTWYDLRLDPAKAIDKWPDVDESGNPIKGNTDIRAAESRAAEDGAKHAATPALSHLDTLGRSFLSIADNGKDQNGNNLNFAIQVALDIEGNDIRITDPRGIRVFEHTFDFAGRKLKVDSKDAGVIYLLPDISGKKPIYSCDANGNEIRTSYDALRRQTDVWVKKMGATEYYLAQKTIYGETKPTAADDNHRGQIWKVYDGAGLVENKAHDFKGNLLAVERVLLKTGKITEPAWAHTIDPVGQPIFEEADALGELDMSRKYVVNTAYDALNRVVQNETPDGTVQELHYNEANLLDRLSVTHARSTEDFVTEVAYNSRGQRTRIGYTNGVSTEYEYDPDTFRLRRIASFRQGLSKDNPDLQNLKYTYDPVGNITCIRDDAHQIVFNHNNRIEPESNYTYDPLYRLVEATGREHEAMTPCHYQQGDKKQTEFIELTNQPINNGQALCNYTQSYTYDKGGNLRFIQHLNRTTNQGWSREQTYEEHSNRIRTSRATPGCPYDRYLIHHDANGNIERLSHLPEMHWDFRNQLVEAQLNHAVLPGDANRAYYQYDASGQRVRKTVVKNSRSEERIYLGGYEIYTVTNGSGPTLRRDTIHVIDDQERIALIEDEKDPAAPANIINSRTRYQLTNHLGSATLEVDERNAAQIISYEEHYPYGGTSYIAHLAGDQHKVTACRKHYRYSGKERDDETGFYYFGARYYAPWLGRWVSCDPAGMVDNTNIFAYVRNSPICLRDSFGFQSENIDLSNVGKNINLNKVATTSGIFDFAGSEVTISGSSNVKGLETQGSKRPKTGTVGRDILSIDPGLPRTKYPNNLSVDLKLIEEVMQTQMDKYLEVADRMGKVSVERSGIINDKGKLQVMLKETGTPGHSPTLSERLKQLKMETETAEIDLHTHPGKSAPSPGDSGIIAAQGSTGSRADEKMMVANSGDVYLLIATKGTRRRRTVLGREVFHKRVETAWEQGAKIFDRTLTKEEISQRVVPGVPTAKQFEERTKAGLNAAVKEGRFIAYIYESRGTFRKMNW